MIECVSLLCEILAGLVLMHGLLEVKFKIDKKLLILLFINGLVFCLINMGLIPRIFQLLAYLALFLYFKLRFQNESNFGIFCAFLCTLFIVCGIEVLIYSFSETFEIGEEHYINIIVNIFVLTCVVLLTKMFDLGKLYRYVTKTKYSMGYILLGCGVLSLIYILGMKFIRIFSFLEAVLFAVIFLIVIVCFHQWKIQRDIIAMKEREIKWLEQCNASFDQLITDVRSRQHDFNNRMDAIYGLKYSCATYEELIQHISKYTDEILEENRFNRLLTMNCPPIVKGFLYYRFCKAYENDIEVNYRIAMEDNIDFSFVYDATEIIGILFDNACEALGNKNKSKYVFVNIDQTDKEIQIIVENISCYIPYKELSSFVKKGYSTKGNNRGYGLYNVKKLVKKYSGEMAINNVEKGGENWIRIFVNLPI